MFCEALNLANVVLQLYLMNFFLGGQFFDYGMDILRVSELPIEERVDPMSKVFPKVSHIDTLCYKLQILLVKIMLVKSC